MSVTTNLPHRHKEGNVFVLEQLPESSSFEPVAQVFKHLSDAARCRIFLLLCHSEECVLNIATIMEMSSPAVSHHLQVLKEAGVVKARKEGTRIYYDLDPLDSEIENMVRLFADIRQIMKNAPDRSGED